MTGYVWRRQEEAVRSIHAKRLATYTVKIDTETKNGPNPGTGFFVKLRSGERPFETYLVTNKHIVKGATEFAIYLSQLERRTRSQINRTLYLPCDGDE